LAQFLEANLGGTNVQQKKAKKKSKPTREIFVAGEWKVENITG
jgi:hypothetical protein